MSALDIFTYAGHEVRRVMINGDPHIVVADIARILGYRDAANAARILRPQHKGYSEVSTPSGAQTMLTTNAAGFNRLILRSNASNAEAVQDWVTDEVLVAIAETGAYAQQETPEHLLARALTVANEIMAAKDTRIAELEPAAAAWDELASASGDYEVADAAKILARAGVETGRQRLFTQLHDLGWIYRGPAGEWKARQSAVDSGYLAEKPMSHHHPRTGDVVLDPPQVRVTVKGLDRLRVRLGTLDLAVAS